MWTLPTLTSARNAMTNDKAIGRDLLFEIWRGRWSTDQLKMLRENLLGELYGSRPRLPTGELEREFSWVTFREAEDWCKNLYRNMRCLLKLGKGSRVVVMGDATEELVLADWTCMLSGYVTIPLDKTAPTEMMESIFSQLPIHCLVCDMDIVNKVLTSLKNVSLTAPVVVVAVGSRRYRDRLKSLSTLTSDCVDLIRTYDSVFGSTHLPKYDEHHSVIRAPVGNPRGVLISQFDGLSGYAIPCPNGGSQDYIAGGFVLPYASGEENSERASSLRPLPSPLVNTEEWDLDMDLNGDFDYDTNPNHIFTITFTSGSTSKPKGVQFSASAFNYDIVSGVAEVSHLYHHIMLCHEGIAHAGRRNLIAVAVNGGRAGMPSDPQNIWEDFKELEPTSASAVPVVWNNLYSHVKREYNALINELSKTGAEVDDEAKARSWQRVMRKGRKAFGRRLRSVASGGAATSPDVMKFLKEYFRVPVYDSFGTTECGSISFDHVAVAQADIKLEDWEEYSTNDKPNPRGEICVKSEYMFAGYYGDEEATAAALTEDGYFRTGDIGEIVQLPEGDRKIRIIDRKKHLFKTSHGEFISPEHVEGLLISLPWIQQLCVIPAQNQVLAVIVPSELTKYPAKDKAVAEFRKLGKEKGLKSFEVPSGIVTSDVPFMVQNGLLTGSSKLNRRAIVKRFEKEIAACNSADGAKDSNESDQMLSVIERILTPQSKLGNEEMRKLLESDFMSLGLDSLTGMRLVKTIQQELGTTTRITIQDLYQCQQLKELFDLTNVSLPKSLLGPSEDSFDDERESLVGRSDIEKFAKRKARSSVSQRLEEDVTEGFTITKRMFSEDADGMVEDDGSARPAVVVTGVTGFLGAHVLASLLMKTQRNVIDYVTGGDSGEDTELGGVCAIENLDANVVCLVRNTAEATAYDRVVKIMIECGYGHLLERTEWSRVVVLPADVTHDKLGLVEEAYLNLASRTRSVIHCAALVHMLASYESCRMPNVVGTLNMLRFVRQAECVGQATVPFHYVSTDSVRSVHRKSDMSSTTTLMGLSMTSEVLDDLTSSGGYSQSKWVAESLVHQAARNGATVTVYRPGDIGPHQESGHYNKSDAIVHFLKETITSKQCPQSEGCLDMTPVDVVAGILALQCIATLGEPTCRSGVKASKLPPIVHILNVAGRISPSSWVDVANLCGVEIEAVPAYAWEVASASLSPEALFSDVNPFRLMLTSDQSLVPSQVMQLFPPLHRKNDSLRAFLKRLCCETAA